MRENNFDNIPRKPLVVVTVKRVQNEQSVRLCKIIGPDNSIQLKLVEREPFLTPLKNGATEIKARAYLNNKGRWALVELVPTAGLEPA